MTTRQQIEQEIKERESWAEDITEEIKKRREWLDVIADFEAGHKMQVSRIAHNDWRDCDSSTPPWADFANGRIKFRRKPEPLRGWVNLYRYKHGTITLGCRHETREAAQQQAGTDCIGQAEFVQVL